MRTVGVVEVKAGHAVGDEGAHGPRVEELRSDRLERLGTTVRKREVLGLCLAHVQDDTPDTGVVFDQAHDTTAALVIDLLATWSAGHADNKSTIKSLSYEVIR